MNYGRDHYENDTMRQKDLVLAANEFCFLQNKNDGSIKTYTGPVMLTISQQESLVVFDPNSKKFREATTFESAKQLFVTAPENWYVILKNPARDDMHPEKGKAMISPELMIGRKVNVRGPASFSLFPGQMCKVIRGHALRSNQYLLARVYEADVAASNKGEMLDTEGNAIEEKDVTYVNGQILVIKGTEVSFYIPPNGIEVIPINNDPDAGYVREAVTLERLEYCILKDEDGNKRYVHGPKVVFPKPTETFVTSPKGGYIFRAIELSPISGIYVKVIAEYTDDKGVLHPVGEELFITGDDQMIYYPRPEHAIINYDEKIMHHAIAIPEGEGRYIMNRLTGVISTVRGPKMYLPDPRTEVVVRRKLTEKQCNLWYPGNQAALAYNVGLTEKSVEKSMRNASKDVAQNYYFSSIDSATTSLASLEAKANISRGTSYTKPRTITLDNKFEGVVNIDVWTGYAVNVVSKNGDREVICGPTSILLDYDQILEVLELSTGKPKTTDVLEKTVFLRHVNNKVADIINVETKDKITASVKVSYCVDFDPNDMGKWFNVENYVKYLCDRQRALIKRKAKEYTIEEFYQSYGDIVRNVAIDAENTDSNRHVGRYFPENGMYVHDCEVLSITVEPTIEKMLLTHQHNTVRLNLELITAQKEVEIAQEMISAENAQAELKANQQKHQMELEAARVTKELEIAAAVARQKEAEMQAAKKAEADMQDLLNVVNDARLARDKANFDARVEEERVMHAVTENHAREMANIEAAKQTAYAETVKNIMESITPDLVAALEIGGKADMMETLAKHMSPYAMAKGESVVETTQKLINGLPFDLQKVLSAVDFAK